MEHLILVANTLTLPGAIALVGGAIVGAFVFFAIIHND